jgi:formylglycine-generating enzyme
MKHLPVVLAFAAIAVTPLSPEKAATRFRVNPKDGLNYAWIPSGTYRTGCLPADHDCFGWERNKAEVKIAEGFWIGQTEVTQLAFQRVMHANPSFYIGLQLPVDSVSWPAAQAYCARIGMRLPTESEWEYAAYGGKTQLPGLPLASIAWYDLNSQDTTHPVGQKLPNGYGLFDMLGNVMEWVSDIDTAPEGPRLIKGGSFFNAARALRVSNRLGAPEDLQHRDVGFRCAVNSW